jgi:DNA-binding MurR/RpiR family transcriptional regulator
MDLAERIRAHELTAGERRVADLVLGDPSLLAFGSVATVAGDAGVGNATVMRFAAKIGFAGFRELQDAARGEMDGRLRQATQRIRRRATGDPVAQARDTELANVQETFERLDAALAQQAAEALARAGAVAVLAGDAARGIAHDFASQLGMVRAGVDVADVGAIALTRSLAWLGRDDILVTIDTARYEESVAAAVERAADAGAQVLAITDSHVSPAARVSTWSFQVVDDGAGPFDSFVGTLALTNLLVSLAARTLGRHAVGHLDRLEAAWDDAGILRRD